MHTRAPWKKRRVGGEWHIYAAEGRAIAVLPAETEFDEGNAEIVAAAVTAHERREDEQVLLALSIALAEEGDCAATLATLKELREVFKGPVEGDAERGMALFREKFAARHPDHPWLKIWAAEKVTTS